MAILDLDELERLHRTKRLRLVTTNEEMQGHVHVDGSPAALVHELLRLARLGQAVEQEGDHGRFNR